MNTYVSPSPNGTYIKIIAPDVTTAHIIARAAYPNTPIHIYSANLLQDKSWSSRVTETLEITRTTPESKKYVLYVANYALKDAMIAKKYMANPFNESDWEDVPDDSRLFISVIEANSLEDARKIGAELIGTDPRNIDAIEIPYSLPI